LWSWVDEVATFACPDLADHLRLPTTILESLLVGTARNLATLEAMPVASARSKYRALLDDDAFSEAALTEGLAKKEKVITRLKRAFAIMK